MKRSLLAWLHWLSLGPDHLSITLDENRRQVFFLRSHMAYRWVREEAVSGNMGNTGFSHSKFPWCHIELPRTCQIQLSKEERSQQPCLWRKKKKAVGHHATHPVRSCTLAGTEEPISPVQSPVLLETRAGPEIEHENTEVAKGSPLPSGPQHPLAPAWWASRKWESKPALFTNVSPASDTWSLFSKSLLNKWISWNCTGDFGDQPRDPRTLRMEWSSPSRLPERQRLS